MIVKIQNSGLDVEWCILEFQGEVIGDLPGSELGDIKIGGVDSVSPSLTLTKLISI